MDFYIYKTFEMQYLLNVISFLRESNRKGLSDGAKNANGERKWETHGYGDLTCN